MRLELTTLAGSLLLATSLVLSLPGVRTVRASDAPASLDPAAPRASSVPEAAAPVCSAEAPTLPPHSKEELARLRTHLEAGSPAKRGGTILLNGRGYNYPSEAHDDLGALLRRIEAESLPRSEAAPDPRAR